MITASTPRRSGSACQSSSASPTRDAASSASTSSQEPGNRTTPNLRPDDRGGAEGLPTFISLDLVVLDQWVGQELLAHLRDARGVRHVELDEPADVDVRDALEAERRQGALDGLALRVEDPRLGPDEDADPRHATRSSHAPNGSPASRS